MLETLSIVCRLFGRLSLPGQCPQYSDELLSPWPRVPLTLRHGGGAVNSKLPWTLTWGLIDGTGNSKILQITGQPQLLSKHGNLNWGKNWSLIARRMSADWLPAFNISCGHKFTPAFFRDAKHYFPTIVVWRQCRGWMGMMARIFVRWEVINVWYCDVSNVSNVPLYSQEDLFNVFWSSVFIGHYESTIWNNLNRAEPS